MSIYTVHTHHAAPTAFFVNSHLIEMGGGVVVIDTQFLVSEARQVREQIAHTGKPLLGIIITHPHPDHFNGVGVLVEDAPNTPVFATEATLTGIRAIEAAKRAEWTPIYGDDYPQTTVFPNHTVRSGEAITLGDVTLRFEDFGPGEAVNETVLYWPKERVLFSADLVYHGVHPYLLEGRSLHWIEQLTQAQRRFAETRVLYPGHGVATDLSAMNAQIAYLNTLHTLIRQHRVADGTVDGAGHAAIKAAMSGHYAGYPLDMLLDGNTDAVARELSGDSTSA